nr:hypothetical protein CFP56_49587 [Quercus suber]
MPQLKSTLEPWTFKRSHNFPESGDARSWEDHDWLEWTSKVGTPQVTPACFMLECDMDPSSNDDQYLVLTQDEEEEEGNDEVISYWSEDDGDWFFNEVGRDFFNDGEFLYDITKAMRIWKPLEEEDWFAELKDLFEKKGEEKNDKP